jgi:hypothetical protein
MEMELEDRESESDSSLMVELRHSAKKRVQKPKCFKRITRNHHNDGFISHRPQWLSSKLFLPIVVNQYLTTPANFGTPIPTISTHHYTPQTKITENHDLWLEKIRATRSGANIPYFKIESIPESDRQAFISSRLKLPSNDLLNGIHYQSAKFLNDHKDGANMFEIITPAVLLAFGNPFLIRAILLQEIQHNKNGRSKGMYLENNFVEKYAPNRSDVLNE